MPAGGINILGIALLTALAGSVGGILLFDVSDFTEKALNSEAASISKVPLDDNTKLALQAALVLLGFVVVAAGESRECARCSHIRACVLLHIPPVIAASGAPPSHSNALQFTCC